MDNVSFAILINGTEYPAEKIDATNKNSRWDGRDTAAITLPMMHAQAVRLFVDGLAWSIKQVNTYPVFDKQGQPTGETKTETQTFDNSDYSVAGSITDNRDGTVTCMMGKPTETETLRAEKADAELAAKILLGEAE
jgi:hypothetical protein|nr:MAG TPA: hypothetical protein [Caudoviricetes sp.]